MTPLGAALAAGVGFALLAKSQRARRASAGARERRHPHPRDRRPSLRKREPYGEGVRRVMLGQLDLAMELLERYRGGAHDDAVHEVRKTLKRLRALLRVVRGEMGEKRYARANAALRDCARRLAGARDAEVMLSTLDALVRAHPAPLASSPGVRALRNQLEAERHRAAALAIDDPRVREQAIAELRAARARVERWRPRERGFKLLAPGLERVYAQGRRRGRRVRRRESIAAMHAWRKRVKELRYAAETLDRGGKRYKPVRAVARRADRLGEMLGEEHDLALLQARVRARTDVFAGERAPRKRLSRLIARRRKQLRKRALRTGKRLYRHPPRRFVRRLARAQ